MNKRSYKLIHLITGLNTGGAEMMLYRLLSKTDRQKFSVSVISLTDVGPIGKKIEELGIPVMGLGMKRGIPNPFFLFKLAKILKREKPDILQTWMYHADLMGLLAGRFAGVKNIVWGIHHSNLDPKIEKRQTILVAKLCSMLSNLPRKIVCCSHASLKCHKQLGYNEEKMVVIPNGFDLGVFQPSQYPKSLLKELSLNKDSLLVGHAARWHGQKDHPNLIKAAKLVVERYPNVHFVLCGDGVNQGNETLSALIKKEGIQNNVHLMGRRNDIHTLMPQFDLYVSSSKAGEAFPIVLGEAMACEVPCVTTDVGDSAYIVGDTGFVVPPENSQALADAMLRYFSLSVEERKRMGKKARQRVESHFALDLVVERYESIYQSLLSEK
ncbi:glycosyltransferase family 4 protein [Geobacillus sp. BK01]|uniref:glycosyltransferase family 4 protein n=1 Tax=Geobacillus sp. BK01 TaxID=3457328 RepID=UPI003FA61226